MRELTLVVLAAGLGTRFGGPKLLARVGPEGETLIDYTVHDALAAGFKRVLFVVHPAGRDQFGPALGRRFEPHIEVSYVVQTQAELPHGWVMPEGRRKPWGTAHALWCCRHSLSGPFGVVNGDDFYGSESFALLAGRLACARDEPGGAEYCMVGFPLEETLSPHGPVSRGICEVGADGCLQQIVEHTAIERQDGVICAAGWENGGRWPAPDAVVSMNMWGFTPRVFDQLEPRFRSFLEQSGGDHAAEFYIPAVVGELLAAGQARVAVLETTSKWFGITYESDLEGTKRELADLVRGGAYPASLWPAGP